MGLKPVDWYCQPEANGVWAKAVSAFGSFTPCAMDSMVICISHLVLFGLCCYRIWMIKKNLKSRRFRWRSNYYNYLLGLLAGYSIAEPLLRLVMGLSLFNPSGKTGFAPFEMTSSIIEALSWCSMLILISLETRIYIREFRWYVRFGVLYVLVGDVVLLNLILGVTDSYSRLCIQAGAAGIIVSNHGARQLDYVPATIMALEEWAVNDRKWYTQQQLDEVCIEVGDYLQTAVDSDQFLDFELD